MGHHLVYRQLLLGVLPGEGDLYEQPPGHALSTNTAVHWSALGFPSRGGDMETISKVLCQIYLKTHQIIHYSNFSTICRSLDGCSVGGGGVSACRTGWSRLFLLTSSVCCAVVYRPGATTGYDIVAAQPSAQRQAANRASYTPYSPTATLSSSQDYYHIQRLQNCSVCRVEYQGASDVNLMTG